MRLYKTKAKPKTPWFVKLKFLKVISMLKINGEKFIIMDSWNAADQVKIIFGCP